MSGFIVNRPMQDGDEMQTREQMFHEAPMSKQSDNELARELEAIDARLRATPTQQECSAAVNDLLRFMDKNAPAILAALQTRNTTLEEAAKAALVKAAEEYAYNPDTPHSQSGIRGETSVDPEEAFKAGAEWAIRTLKDKP